MLAYCSCFYVMRKVCSDTPSNNYKPNDLIYIGAVPGPIPFNGKTPMKKAVLFLYISIYK